MKKITCDMRYGECCRDVNIGHNGGGVLEYVNAFLPHWREFANALVQYQHALKCLPGKAVSKLTIANVELPKAVLDLLSNALKSTHFKKIKLEDNRFGRDGIQFALNYLTH